MDKIGAFKKVVLVAVIFFAAMGCFSVVGVGERGVRVTMGSASDNVVEEGLTFKLPFVQNIVKFDVRTIRKDQMAVSYSKDIQTVEVGVALNYHLAPEQVVSLYKEIGMDYESRIILPAIQESVKTVVANYTAQELVEKREEVKERIRVVLYDRLNKKYLVTDDFSITNFDFSDAYEQAIESKQTAQQNALKAENDLKRIQIEAEQKVTAAKAEAETIRIQAEAIQNQGGDAYVQLKAVEQWDGKLPQYMLSGDGAIPFIDLKK